MVEMAMFVMQISNPVRNYSKIPLDFVALYSGAKSKHDEKLNTHKTLLIHLLITHFQIRHP